MPPTPKNVLMAIADRADDDGVAWPSIPGLCEATCFKKTAVIDALKWLDAAGLIRIDKARGRNNVFTITLDRFPPPVRETDHHPSARRTGANAEPVRQTDLGSPPNGPPPVRETDQPVRQTDPNHHEPSVQPSGNHQKARRKGAAHPDRPSLSDLLPEVTPQVLDDWLEVRKAKRVGPVSETVAKLLRSEASKAGLSLQQAVEMCCARGWASLKAEWLQTRANGAHPPPRDDAAMVAAVRQHMGQRADFSAMDYTAGIAK